MVYVTEEIKMGEMNATEQNMKDKKKHTVQLWVLANLLASAWIQYATSARGRTIEVAANISAEGTAKKRHHNHIADGGQPIRNVNINTKEKVPSNLQNEPNYNITSERSEKQSFNRTTESGAYLYKIPLKKVKSEQMINTHSEHGVLSAGILRGSLP